MILTLCFLVFKCFLSFRFSHKVTLRREVIFIGLVGGFEGVRFMKMKLSGIHCFRVVVCSKTHVDPLFKEFLVYIFLANGQETNLSQGPILCVFFYFFPIREEGAGGGGNISRKRRAQFQLAMFGDRMLQDGCCLPTSPTLSWQLDCMFLGGVVTLQI